jgi:hypothetical protein
MLDLELLHFFTTSTAHSYHQNPIARRVMSINVPQLGFTHDFAMHGILALAGLHLAKCQPERRDICISQAIHHHEAGLKKASLVLSEINQDNASALYMFTALTFLYTLASTTLHQSDNFLLVGEAGIAEWIILVRQSYFIVRMAGETLRTGPLGPMFAEGSRRAMKQDDHPSSEGSSYLQELATHINKTVADEDARGAYSLAIEALVKVYNVVEDRSQGNTSLETSDIFIWPYKVSDDYLDLLQKPTQEALLIIAFFAVLPMRFVGNVGDWFLEDFSIHLISKIHPLLDEDHISWAQWPIQQIGWKPEPQKSYSM